MSNQLSTIDLIGVFVAVMTTGSLTAAANQLGRAQPTVRRQVERLEQDLGVALFTRSSNGLIPTETARALLPSAMSVESNAEAFVRAASAHADSHRGTVRITCSRLFATYRLPAFIAQMRSERPEITIELAAVDGVENLLEREADIAIRLTHPRQLALIARKVAPLELGIFANAGQSNALSHLGSVEEMLAKAPFIWNDRDPIMDIAVSRLDVQLPRNVALRTDDQVAQVSAIVSGVGVGICQTSIADQLGLHRLIPEWCFELPAWIVMHEDQSQIMRIRYVFDQLVDWFLPK